MTLSLKRETWQTILRHLEGIAAAIRKELEQNDPKRSEVTR